MANAPYDEASSSPPLKPAQPLSRIRISLAMKGVVFLALPIIIQGFILFRLWELQDQAKQNTRQCRIAAEVSETVSHLMVDHIDPVTSIFGALDKDLDLSEDYQVQTGKVISELEKLKSLLSQSPSDVALVDLSIEKDHQVIELGAEAIKRRAEIRRDNEARKHLVAQLFSMRQYYEPLFHMGKRMSSFVVDESPAYQAKVRKDQKQFLDLLFAIDVFMFVLGALFLYLHIVARLNKILDNSKKLALGENPDKPAILFGLDEISDVGESLHDMAAALIRAARKERATIDNASDMICSLNRNLIFITSNPASRALLGLAPQELVGRELIDLVEEQDRHHALQSLNRIVQDSSGTGGESSFDLRLRHESGTILDAQFSAVWSEDSQSLFCVVHDISERKQAERLQKEVMQMVSHDLRSPLTSIQAILDMFRQGIGGEMTAEGENLLALADRNAVLMLRLVNDFLDMEKLEAGMLELDRSLTSIDSVFDESMQIVKVQADAKQIELHAEPSALTAVLDRERLVQVLSNLLSNAIKFSPKGSAVKLAASETVAGGIQIDVSDQGRGIPVEMQSTIFERFKQVQGSDTKIGGAGLGLAICKALVELHGGSISVKSAPDQGSTFTITLPGDGGDSA